MTARTQQFLDPTYLDCAMRRRSHYKLDNPEGKTRLLLLMANAVTRTYDTERAKVIALQRWVCESVPHVAGGDSRGASDNYRQHGLDLLKRGSAACEGTAEVFAAMAWLSGIPARIIAVMTEKPPAEGGSGHCVNEAFIEGKWVFVDADTYRRFEMEDGTLASARELLDRHELIDRSEEKRCNTEWEEPLSFLRNFTFADGAGNYTYSNWFHTICVQEAIFSLDGCYGEWIENTPETEDYLYGSPKHPDAAALLKDGLPWYYTRVSTVREDHLARPWYPPGWSRG